MQVKFQQIIYFTFVILFVAACKKTKDEIPDLGYNYYPVEVGSYIVYDVDSIYYDDFNNTKDTFKFQLKHKIESQFIDNEGRTAYRIERSVKFYNPSIPYNQQQWQLRDVWVANKTNTTAELVEENTRYIKLAFPVKETQKWNGNAQNTSDAWQYEYNFFDLPRTHGGVVYDSVLEVNQFDDKGAILTERKFFVERYARNVGLIYKRVIDIESQPPSSYTPQQLQQFFSKPILERVTSGYQFTYTINTYGTE